MTKRQAAAGSKPKTTKAIREALEEARREADATLDQIHTIEGAGDSSQKTLSRLAGLLASQAIHRNTVERLTNELHESQRADAAGELEAARAALQAVEGEFDPAVDAIVEAVWPHMRFPDDKDKGWHDRRRHELRHMAKQAHGPSAITTRISAARGRLSNAETAIKQAEGAEA